MRVLVIEDDDQVAEGIAVGLRRAGMAVDVAFDGSAGLELALPGVHDVVVLDRDLPGLHGDKVCAALVQGGNPPRVVMLTAAAEIDDRVEGLALGAAGWAKLSATGCVVRSWDRCRARPVTPSQQALLSRCYHRSTRLMGTRATTKRER
jgi:CheY-like chemotaxis protein